MLKISILNSVIIIILQYACQKLRSKIACSTVFILVEHDNGLPVLKIGQIETAMVSE